MEKENLISEICKLLNILESPLSKSNIDDGWTPQAQQAWINYFLKYKQEIQNKAIPEEALVAYGLAGSWGGVDGKLFSHCCKVGALINEWRTNTSK